MKKERQSNMELLRIVAMFLVLLVHADFFSIGAPSASDCVNRLDSHCIVDITLEQNWK